MIQRPTVIGGVDAFSHEIATRLVEMQTRRYPDEENIEVVRFGNEESIAALKTCLANQRERLRTRHDNPIPRVVMFSAAFDAQSMDGLSQLAAVSETLSVALPGDQEIVMVVLLPPPVAADAEKITAYKYFMQLEPLAFGIRFLKTVLVHPVSQAMYSDGVEDTGDSDVLFKLLGRQLFDADIDNVIQSSGGAAIGNKTRTAGRNGCYTTSGAFTLIYKPDECIAYLQARLQKILFEEDLMDTASLESDIDLLKQIQDKSDALVHEQMSAHIAFFESQQKRFPEMGETVTDVEALEAKIQNIRAEIQAMVKQLSRQTRTVSDKPDAVAQTLSDYLAEGPGYFAGADLYLQSLGGRQLVTTGQEEAIPLSGVDRFQQEVYLQPLLAAIESCCAPYVSAHLRSARIDQNPDADTTWVEDAALACDVEPDTENLMVSILCQSLTLLNGHLNKDHFILSNSVGLFEDLLGLLQRAGEQYDEQVKACHQTLETADQDLVQFKKELGTWKRLISKRGEVKAEQLKNEALHKSLRDELDALGKQFIQCQQFIFDLLQKVVLSAIVCASDNQGFAEKVAAVSDQFIRYLSGIQEGIDHRWRLACAFSHENTPTSETVLNETILEQQFQKIVDRTVCTVDHLLAWQPLSSDDYGIKAPDYESCRDLADHYAAGAKVLDNRLQDYAAAQVAPVQKLTILDILETVDKTEARVFLKHRLERLDRFIDLSPGLMPLVHQDSKALKTVVVRSAKSVLGRLSSDHGDLFNSDTRWLNDDDANTIDLTGLYFGLPAFVIHVLSECRALYQKTEEESENDLWPLDVETVQ